MTITTYTLQGMRLGIYTFQIIVHVVRKKTQN